MKSTNYETLNQVQGDKIAVMMQSLDEERERMGTFVVLFELAIDSPSIRML